MGGREGEEERLIQRRFAIYINKQNFESDGAKCNIIRSIGGRQYC